MNITVPEGMERKEWFTLKEFAAGVKITPHAVNQWIHRHPTFSEKYCQNISTSPKKTKWLIFWEGVSVYLSQKNIKSSNPHTVRGLESAKEGVGRIANETIKMQPAQMTPVQALLQAVQQMVEIEERLKANTAHTMAIQESVVQLEQRVEEMANVVTSPVPVTAGQRQFLNERVRKYCIEHNLPYHIVWRQIHEYVGIAAVHKYEIKHYQAALKYLEKMYIETGLVW